MYAGAELWHRTAVREKDRDCLDFLSGRYLFCNTNTHNLNANMLTSELSPGAQLCGVMGVGRKDSELC